MGIKDWLSTAPRVRGRWSAEVWDGLVNEIAAEIGPLSEQLDVQREVTNAIVSRGLQVIEDELAPVVANGATLLATVNTTLAQAQAARDTIDDILDEAVAGGFERANASGTSVLTYKTGAANDTRIGLVGSTVFQIQRWISGAWASVLSISPTGTLSAPLGLQTTGTVIASGVETGTLASTGEITRGGVPVVTMSRTISAGTGLAGGGDLTTNRTLSLSTATQASLAKADTAVQSDRQILAGTGLGGGGTLAADRTLSLSTATQNSLDRADSAVQPSRAVLTGTGLAGGGDLTTNRTLSLSTATQNSLDRADSAVQPSRTISAGTGLAGGGDLTTNRTLSLSTATQTSLAKADTAVQPNSTPTFGDVTGTGTATFAGTVFGLNANITNGGVFGTNVTIGGNITLTGGGSILGGNVTFEGSIFGTNLTMANNVVIDGSVTVNTTLIVPNHYSTTTAAAANVVVNSSGVLLRSTSGSEWKTDVERLQDAEADKILLLEDIWYRSLCDGDPDEWGWHGFLAEQVGAVEPSWALWEARDDGSMKAVGVQDGKLIPAMVNLIRRMSARIDALEGDARRAGS